MKQSTAISVIKISSIVSIAAVAITVLAAILSKNAIWWLTITGPLYQAALLIAAFWGWSPEDRDRLALLIVGIIRLVATAGMGFSALLAMFREASFIQVGSLLQPAAAALFVIGVILYGKEKRERE